MSIQVIKKNQKADYIIIPYDEFLSYADRDLIDSTYIQDVLNTLEDGEIIDFSFADFVDNPVLLRRLHAGLTQKELAEKMDVT